MWTIFSAIAIILLVIFWFAGRRNAIYGGLTLGVTIGLIINIFFILKGGNFNWYVVEKGAILGIIVGFIAELIALIPEILDKLRKKN
jgi:Na+/proline symporter